MSEQSSPDSALKAAKEFVDDEFSECSDLPRKTRLAALSELIDAALRAPAQGAGLTEQQIIDRERYRCVKLCERWIETFNAVDIQYTSPKEYATDAINDIIDLITDGQDVRDVPQGAPTRGDLSEIGHWIAAPMKNVGTLAQFHEVVDRAVSVLAAHDWRPMG